VQRELTSFFPDAVVSDVHKQKGQMDRVLHIDGCKIAIEVKNVLYVKKDDLTRFRTQAMANQPDAAIFVSMQRATVLGGVPFTFEMDPVPMVLIDSFGENPNMLRCAVEVLRNVVERKRKYGGSGLDVESMKTGILAIINGPAQFSIRQQRSTITTLWNQLIKLEEVFLNDIPKALNIDPGRVVVHEEGVIPYARKRKRV
jgi:hypothetical protein